MINFVIFDQKKDKSQGFVSIDEVQYIFQIGYQLFEKIINQPLKNHLNSLESTPMVSILDQDQIDDLAQQIENEVIESVFGKNKQSELEDLQSIVLKISSEKTIIQFIQLFQFGKVLDATIPIKTRKRETIKQVSDSIVQSTNSKIEIRTKQNSELSKESVENQKKENFETSKNQQLIQSTDHKNNESSIIQEKQEDQQKQSEMIDEVEISEQDNYNYLEVPEFTGRFTIKNHTAKNQTNIVKVGVKLQKLREENKQQQKVFDYGGTLHKLEKTLKHIQDFHFTFFGQRQIINCMETKIADNFYRWDHLTKFKLSQARSQIMHIYSSNFNYFGQPLLQRGQKRLLVQKKFLLEGQISMLQNVFKVLYSNQSNLDLLKDDLFYERVYLCMQDIYDCKVDQKFVIDYFNIKTRKRENKRFESFLEGAMVLLQDFTQSSEGQRFDQEINEQYQIQAKAFKNIKNHLNFMKQGDFKQTLKQNDKFKQKQNDYYFNIGKFKGLYKLFEEAKKVNVDPEYDLKPYFQQRMEKLKDKIEEVDIKLVSIIQNRLEKQKVIKQYFFTVGQSAVIKCQRKFLDFSNIYHYFTLESIKLKTQEAIQLYLDYDNLSPPKKIYSEDYLALSRLQKLKSIDRILQVGPNQTEDPVSQKLFKAEIQIFLANDSFQISSLNEFTKNDNEEKLRATQNQTPDFILSVTKQFLTIHYKKLGIPDQVAALLPLFENGPLKCAFLLEHKQKKELGQVGLLREFDKLDNFIMDFISFNEGDDTIKNLNSQNYHVDQTDLEIMEYLNLITTSFKNIYQDDIRKIRNQELKKFLKDNKDYYTKMMNTTETEYISNFKSTRDLVFIQGAKTLFQFNKKGFLNGFHLRNFSQPIERSIQYNYWAYQTIKTHLQEQQKEKIFTQVMKVAQINEIYLPALQQVQNSVTAESYNLTSGQDQIINITQQNNLYQKQFKSKSLKQIYQSELINFIGSNQDDWAKKGKQSFLRKIIQQLEQQSLSLDCQVNRFQTLSNKLQDFNYDCAKLNLYLRQQIINQDDSKTEIFNSYKKYYQNYSQILSARQIEQVIAGGVKYTNMLREFFSGLLLGNEEGIGKNLPVKNLSEFSNRFNKVLSSLQMKTADKQRILAEELQSKHDQLQKLYGGTRSGGAQRVTSPTGQIKGSNLKTKEQTTGQKNLRNFQPFELEMREKEQELIESMLSQMNQQKMYLLCQGEVDGHRFNSKIMSLIQKLNDRKVKIELMLNFCKQVAGYLDKGSDQALSNAKYQIKGGRLLSSIFALSQVTKASILPANIENSIIDSKMVSAKRVTTKVSNVDLNESKEFQDNEQQLPSSKSETKPSPKEKLTNRVLQTPSLKFQVYLFTFLEHISNYEDILSAKRMINFSNIFYFTNQFSLEVQILKDQQEQRIDEEQALISSILNVYEIANTDQRRYFVNNQLLNNFVHNSLFHKMLSSNQNYTFAIFFQVIKNMTLLQEESLVKKLEEFISSVSLEDEERNEFNNSQAKIKRYRQQEIRSFQQYLEMDSINNQPKDQEKIMKILRNKLVHSISFIKILTRIQTKKYT